MLTGLGRFQAGLGRFYAKFHSRKRRNSLTRLRLANLHTSAAEKRGLWEGVVQEPLRRALFCVFLCSEVIFSCKSHRNFFQKLPLQFRHFLENPLAKNPKTQLLIKGGLAVPEEPPRGFCTSSAGHPTVKSWIAPTHPHWCSYPETVHMLPMSSFEPLSVGHSLTTPTPLMKGCTSTPSIKAVGPQKTL